MSSSFRFQSASMLSSSSPGCAGWDRLVIEAINYAKKRGIYIGK